MSDLLSTRELQEILNVDRTTIYRMVNSGQLPAIRVGNQWRFPRRAVEEWLRSHQQGMSPTPSPQQVIPLRPRPAPADLFPLECVQYVQDAFADLLGVTMVVTDLEGRPITTVSNPCGLYRALAAYPQAQERCVREWAHIARNPTLTPRFYPTCMGLLYARAFVRVNNELKAMVIAGGIAPDRWPPTTEEVERMAKTLGVPADVMLAHIDEVHKPSAAEQQRVLHFLQRIADIFSHIASEREGLVIRLHQIAELATL